MKWERVAEDDPNRCQAVDGAGQCPYKAVEGTKYCPRHGANKTLATTKAEAIRNYNLGKWRDRVNNLLIIRRLSR
jgi:hypothetical protein